MIGRWLELDPTQQTRSKGEIREIFFLSSSRQDIADEAEKEKFWHNWTSYYFSNEPDLIFVSLMEDRTIGYLMGCCDSTGASQQISQRIASYRLFDDLFPEYPAHLHMNLHPDFRGQGLGEELVQAFVSELMVRQIRGVHLVTTTSARNVRFYKKTGFEDIDQRRFRDADLLFMGRSLPLLA